MDKRFGSIISLDSLELDSKKDLPSKDNVDEKMVDTILVPFYENDILIKVSKSNKKKQKVNNKPSKIDPCLGDSQQCNGYLINKNLQKGKKMSYLEMFRKQFSGNINEKNSKNTSNEIRSISPEFGDTERESFGEEYNNNNTFTDFYNTEAYNEVYYEQLIHPDVEEYLEESFDDGLCFNDDIEVKNLEDFDDNNLRSISEVSRPRRHTRRTTAPINQNIKLGGLGPDVENIRPRLERAKSLQRYSEKVRMENRLRMYKKDMEIEKEKEKNAEKEKSAKHRRSSDKNNDQKGKKTSYLVDKTSQAKTSVDKKCTKSHHKSSDEKEQHSLSKDNKPTDDGKNPNEKESKPNRVIERKLLSAKESLQKYIKPGYETTRKKASARSQATSAKQKDNNVVSPVEIRFTVNVGGVRPSSALKSLEEKHRIYQEKVKEFTMEPNKG